MERTVLVWRYFTAHYRGGHDGFHDAGAGVPDVAAVREPAAQGQLQGGTADPLRIRARVLARLARASGMAAARRTVS